ncbi:hypothetical protein CALCODRAFT_440201 [Calocera cornea HHB12733]|uniref:Pre-rRNA-processing protein TSR2 n=1 Tax=Calocera cornea HHB12733 TaxID=1353952 RepID=A0A165DR79_9BASI|nr:hypothetical protein CALCODRAFT_440201 [Calocera cornea HHB12733]
MTSSTPAPTPAQLTLFARSVLAHLRLWPALRLALSNDLPPSSSTSTTPSSSSQSVQLFASEIVELFAAAKGQGPGEEDVEDLLLQVMDEEYETLVEDDSAEGIARGLITSWRGLADPSAEAAVKLLEEQADRAGRTKLQVQRREEVEETSEDGEDEGEGEGEGVGEGDMDVEMTTEEAPQLVERTERAEPVVDDDGFTLVQKKVRR